jgi:hypothetical protein
MELIKFFEHTTGIKLKWYQKAYLMALYQGKTVVYPRQHSRKLFLEKIKEYNEKFTN